MAVPRPSWRRHDVMDSPGVHVYGAKWLLTMTGPPIRDGLVAVRDGWIVGVGTQEHLVRPIQPTGQRDEAIIELGSVVVLPGLVNAHVHLELSWLRGRVPPTDTMPEWARRVVDLRRPIGPVEARAIDRAVSDLRASGTALVGDVSNTLASFGPLSRSRVGGVVFLELIGFRAAQAERAVDDARRALDELPETERLQATLAAHAPYSVAPALFQAITGALARRSARSYAVHLGESSAEVEFLAHGTGPWEQLLRELGVWDTSWSAPSCSPVEYLDRLGFLGDRLLVVHGVQLTRTELERLSASGATLVTCPRSNAWTGAGVPPIAAFYASGLRVAIGTDSLASSPDLHLFGELLALRRLAPSVPARTLLRSATVCGAEALGFRDHGTVEPGKRADLIAVDVPGDVVDVEEYLLGGIDPRAVAWLEPRSV